MVNPLSAGAACKDRQKTFILLNFAIWDVLINLYADSFVDEDEHSDQKAGVYKCPTSLADTRGKLHVERLKIDHIMYQIHIDPSFSEACKKKICTKITRLCDELLL